MDVSERYYQVYNYCLDQVQQAGQDLQYLSKAEFWQRKRAKVPELEIGLESGLSPQQAQDFAHIRHETIHTLPYLSYDQPLPEVKSILRSLQEQGIDLVLMTMRRVRELDEALERNQLTQFFPLNRRYCLGNDYQKTGDTNDKPLLMKRAMTELPPAETVWMVGDTEADILAAQQVNIPAIAVLSGIRNREQLERYQPDEIVPNLAAAAHLFVRCAMGKSDEI